MLRCLFERDSKLRPLFPGTRSHPAGPSGRTRCKLRVKLLTLALSTRIPPQGKPLLLKRNVFQTTPRELVSNTFHKGRRRSDQVDCAKRYQIGRDFSTQSSQSRTSGLAPFSS